DEPHRWRPARRDRRIDRRIESARDIEAELHTREALAESERQFRMAMEGSPEGMALVDMDRRLTSVNTALCRLLGRSREWMLAHHVDDFVHPEDLVQDQLIRARLHAGASTERTDERRLVAADGRVVWVLHSIGLLRDTDHQPLFYVSHFQDITNRKSTESLLEFAATHDSLTGLANRSHLVGELQRALSASRRSGRLTAVVMMDLDHFKVVNDSLGHAAGDDLLIEAAGRLLRTVRDADLVARHGGDDFVIVMRDLAEATEAVRVATRIVEAFRLPFKLGANEVYTTASVGVSVSGGGADGDALLAEADAALYAAKEDGRDCSWLFNQDLREEVVHRLLVESGLRHAIELGEFEVWFQPEISLEDGSTVGLEALLRWRHSDGSVTTAGDFIEIADDSGLIVDVGSLSIRAACTQIATWATELDQQVVVRVNLSARQLADHHLLAVVDDALRLTGASPALLSFEIAESAMLRDLPAVDANLHGLHRRGITVAIDDFGTGFASLTALRDFSVTVLKLDPTLVVDVATSEVDRRLVAGVIALARSLDIAVVAKGVETDDQLVVLRELGCHCGQGWLWSPAVAAEQVVFPGRTVE
ncbi:MAG: EAL domain-containing protein, partial [Ilumatobacteraceae bacterium]